MTSKISIELIDNSPQALAPRIVGTMNPISKILLAIAALIILLTGMVPSIFTNDWTWFGRSGAILTAYGIVITYLDLQGFLAKSVEDISARIDKHLETHDLSQVPDEKIDQIEAQKDAIFAGIIKSMRRVEFSILVLGTIIWGYGDLIGP